MRLKIRRLDPTIPLPSYGTDEAAAADVAVVPAGHFLGIFARSSTPLKGNPHPGRSHFSVLTSRFVFTFGSGVGVLGSGFGSA